MSRQLEQTGYDIPFPTTEHNLDEELDAMQPANETSDFADKAIKIEGESPASKSPVIDDVVAPNKPLDKMFFFKRFLDGHPRLDILFEVGAGQLHPDINNEDYAIWEASDSLYIYRKSGPHIKVLQSVGSVEYTDILCPTSTSKYRFSQKTCGFVGTRDSQGQLHVLKLAISGTSFHPRRDEDRKNFMFHAKWVARVKHLAKEMKMNLRTIFDGHSRKTKPENVGNWRAGHVEKKLSTHIVWTYLAMHGLGNKASKVSLKDLHRLRRRLHEKGLKPQFELHLSRGPCGTTQRPGQCVPFVQKLARLTGIRFTIHSWEENVILDGSLPSKCPPRPVLKTGLPESAESPDAYDSEAEDLDAFLEEAEGQKNIVHDGFEEVIPQPMVRRFGDSIRKYKRHPDDIRKPYPPTPVTEEEFWGMNPYGRASSRSHFWEDRRTPSSSRRRRSAASEDKRDRRARKHEVRRRRAAASGSEGTQHSAEMSALASRLGGLLNSSRRLR